MSLREENAGIIKVSSWRKSYPSDGTHWKKLRADDNVSVSFNRVDGTFYIILTERGTGKCLRIETDMHGASILHSKIGTILSSIVDINEIS